MVDIKNNVCEVETKEMEMFTCKIKGKFVVGSSTGVQKTINKMVKKLMNM